MFSDVFFSARAFLITELYLLSLFKSNVTMFTLKLLTCITYITMTLVLPHKFSFHAIWVFALLGL